MKSRVVLVVLLMLCAGAGFCQAPTLTGIADPQVVTLSAGQQAGVSYIIRNSSAQRLTLATSTADFVVGGITISTVTLPVNSILPANSTSIVPSNVSISRQVQNAARAAATDIVTVVRRFRTPPLPPAGLPQQVNIPVTVKIGSSLAGPASVTQVALDVPSDGKTVGLGEQIRGRAFIRGTGTGAIAGAWYVDEMPVETFAINMTAGLTQEVRTRLTLPTTQLGPHNVRLQITRPAPVTSNTQTYMVVQGGESNHRVFAVLPSDGSPVPTDAPHTSFRWLPMPGASGYEIAFASDLSGLGLDKDGRPTSPLLNLQTWSSSSPKLLCLAKAPSDALAWTPSDDELARIASSPSGNAVWAVRAIYPAQAHGDPSTTSKPRAVKILPRPAPLALISPVDSAKLTTAFPKFEWQAGPEGATYEFAIVSRGKVVFRALTRGTIYALGELSPFKLAPGTYSWRVSAVRSGEGVVAASGESTFVVEISAAAASPTTPLALSRPPQGAVSKGAAFILAGGLIGALPGAASEITIMPGDGSSITDQQPQISATYPETKAGGVLLTLNGVDVTALADITSTGLSLQPPGVFNPGDHTIGLVALTSDGRKLEAASKFTVAAPESAPQVEAPPQDVPLQLNLDWNWNPNNDTYAADTLTIDLNLRGRHIWTGSSAAVNAAATRPLGEKFDLSSFLAQGSLGNGDYQAMAGDIGSDGSELTDQGGTYRQFMFTSSGGPVRFAAAHTLGRALQMSSVGSVPDMFYLTAETAQSTASGLKLSYIDSSTNNAPTSGFDGQTDSKVLSLSGHSPIGGAGINASAELARSDSTFTSALGMQSQTDNAVNAALNGTFAGFALSATYRMVGSGYASPASTTLASNLRGWTFGVSRPFGQYINAGLNYSLLDNAANSNAPASSLISKSLDVALAYPNLPSITLQVARNDASADPFTVGTTGSRTQDTTWSIGANYAKSIWDAYANYSRSSFTDFLDFANPLTDTPNDRASGTWACGFGVRPARAVKLRFDWGANDSSRWFRPQLSPNAISGVDRSDQFRAELEYLINARFSSTVTVSNSDYADALGNYTNNARNLGFRLNYLLKAGKSGGGLVLTGELMHSDFAGSAQGDGGNTYSILVNENRMFSF